MWSITEYTKPITLFKGFFMEFRTRRMNQMKTRAFLLLQRPYLFEFQNMKYKSGDITLLKLKHFHVIQN